MVTESYLQTVFRRFKRHHLAAFSLVVLAFVCGAALLAPVIAPYEPEAIVGPFGGAPCREFLLGTDQIGRDVLSRLLYATRISLLVGIMATVISTVIGVVLGLLAGYFGGVIDMVIMRFTDMVMSFPCSGLYFSTRIMEYYSDPRFCGLAGCCPTGTGECAVTSGNEFRQRQYRGRYAAAPHSVFGNTAQYGGADPCVRDFRPGAVNVGRGGAEFPRNGCAAADAESGQYVKRRAVAYRTDKTAVAVAAARSVDRAACSCHQFCRGCAAGRA